MNKPSYGTYIGGNDMYSCLIIPFIKINVKKSLFTLEKAS
ncbi:hypothetical protein VCRA2128O305_100102 [Vibrio crassostreae]|nr:hypothetical protein VCRA2117O380_100080 [Vibrio crassostreae]CAK1700740.1 hypothetical protein VCRA2112O185_100082 [Vibrio crassostreae]CAK1701610.1 hypothetical protein VCRA2114E123_100093 [Vibrio crassostreae]CAK1702400.1 hypothetical protein VCRA2117O379_100104 [Vibrio crassostreae]CAK1702701.1 hypothetical protein VCRA2113O119_100109 [Vibrio crassostreae]